MKWTLLAALLSGCATPNMEPGLNTGKRCPTTEVRGIDRDHEQVDIARKICKRRGQKCLLKYRVAPVSIYMLCGGGRDG